MDPILDSVIYGVRAKLPQRLHGDAHQACVPRLADSAHVLQRLWAAAAATPSRQGAPNRKTPPKAEKHSLPTSPAKKPSGGVIRLDFD